MNRVVKGLTVPKTLLEFQNEVWSAKMLAKLSGVSLKTCYSQINGLLEKGLLHKEEKGFFTVIDRSALRQYLENVHDAPKWRYFFAPDDPEYFGKRLEEIAERKELIYAMTGELGLWAYHQHVQPLRTHIRIPKKFEKGLWKEIENDLLAVPCQSTRATIFVSSTNDPYPFLRTRTVNGYRVAPFVQVYLDCRALGARLAEGAQEAWRLVKR